MTTIGRYTIQDELGRGAMGVVYRAWDQVLERPVALKELVLPENVGADVREDLVARFLREARAAARLQHPNVVHVFDVLSEGDRHFIAMELLEGAPLGDLLERGPLPEGAAREALLQVLDAVGAAHAAGIVHRDLKPDNIHLLEDGRIKVTDFGIAKLNDTSHATHATQIGTIIGTPGYMSPEQVQGLPVDGRSDIFSVGVVGCELFGGQSPFQADSPTSTLYRIVNEPPMIPSGVPPQVAAVLMKALQKDPGLRYPTAGDMVNDLRTGAFPVVGTAQSAPTYVSSPAPQPVSEGGGRSTLVAVGAVLGVAAALLLVFALAKGGGSGAVATAPTAAPQAVPAAPQAEPVAEPTPEPVPAPAPAPAASYEPPPAPFWGVFVGADAERGLLEAKAATLRAEGFTPYIFNTIDYSTIGKPGQSIWVLSAGAWDSQAEADAEVSHLQGYGYTNAYSKRVAR